MDRKSTLPLRRGLLCIGLILCLLLSVACSAMPQNEVSEHQAVKALSKQDSQKIAIDFLRSSPTFRFDGIEDTLKLVWSSEEKEPQQWEFHYEFQSRHAGYGDRTGLILAQVITDHKAEIVVKQGEVVYAVLDRKWDMLRQEMIK